MSNNVSRSRGTPLSLLHPLEEEKGFSDAHEVLSPLCSLNFSSSSSKLDSTCQFVDSRRAATAYTEFQGFMKHMLLKRLVFEERLGTSFAHSRRAGHSRRAATALLKL
jgi:hypothetical protein